MYIIYQISFFSFQLTQEPDKEEALMDVGHLLEKEAAQKRFSHYSMLLSAFKICQ